MSTKEFRTNLTVNIEHINYGNHLAHDKLISMMHEARIRFFESLEQSKAKQSTVKQSELAFYGVGLIIKSLTVNYRKEVFRGQTLTFIITIDEIRGSAFSLHYDIVNEQGESIGDGVVVLVAFNYQTRKVTRLSEECRQTLADYVR